MWFLRIVALMSGFALVGAIVSPVSAQQNAEKRIALVIGESAYTGGALATGANDAGLVSQTLQAAGFDVTGARDLETQQLRDALHEFVEKARAAGPETVAMVYFAGYGLQADGENFLAAVDARIDAAADLSMNSIRASDFVRPLAALPLKARIVVLDAAHKNPFVKTGQSLAGGLAMTEPDDGSLIAFNAAPGTIGPEEQGPYGAYAKALVEMIKAGGAPVNDMFERVRLRVSEATQGAENPWSASRISAPIVFFAHTAEAPKDQSDHFAELTSKPITSFGPRDAYLAAMARDTIEGYEEFLAAFPNDPLAKRVRAMVAARRESVVWRETCSDRKPRAYWTYLKRYPRGPHVYEARRALSHLAVAVEPPPSFDELVYDVPPPPPDEIVFVEDRPVFYFDDPVWGFAPPPPLPAIYLAPPPAYYVDLPPPPPPIAAFILPIPVFYPVAAWVAPPVYVAPAPVNVFAANIHNTVVVNQANNTVTVTNAAGQHLPPLPANAPTPAANIPAPAAGVLHPAVAGAAAALPIAAAAALHRTQLKEPAANHALPSANGPAGAPPAKSFAAPGPKNVAPLAGPGRTTGARNQPLPHQPPLFAKPDLAPSTAAAPPATARVNPHAPLARNPPSFAEPRHEAPRFAAPHQPGAHFAAPQHAAPQLQPRQAGPHFGAPSAGGRHQQFAPRREQHAPGPRSALPQQFAPRPQAPHFAAPAAPHFAAPRPAPAFQSQHFSPPRPAPMAAPHFAAPPRPAAPRPAPDPGRGGKGPHLPGQ